MILIGNLYSLERHSSSFLGGSLSVDALSKKKWTAITGVRYRNNSLLVNSQDTQLYACICRYTNKRKLSGHKVGMEFFRTSQNKYQYQPLTETKFGTLDNPMALTVYYEGQEKINTTLILEL
jgi:hypothetical protein